MAQIESRRYLPATEVLAEQPLDKNKYYDPDLKTLTSNFQ